MYLLHGMLHEFINIPVVLLGILVLKITTKSEHDVVSSVITGLKENILDEGIHTLIHIVAHEIRVILK